MIVFGLTGSIGMGKSTVAQMFSHMGAAIHNADTCVHKALEPGGGAFEEVALTFPDAWDKKRHILKRDILRDIIFNDDNAKEVLEGILHPLVRADEVREIRKQKRLGRKAIVLDIPLLFETGADRRVDVTVTVTAPYAVQRRRVLARPGMTDARFHKILDSQMPDSEKRARSDYSVFTHMGRAHTFAALKRIYRDHI